MKQYLFLIFLTMTSLAAPIYATTNFNDEIDELPDYSCRIQYVGPAAQEKATCSGFTNLIDNESRNMSSYISSHSVSGTNAGESCCQQAVDSSYLKCRDVYSRSTIAGKCVINTCNCTQYIRQL